MRGRRTTHRQIPLSQQETEQLVYQCQHTEDRELQQDCKYIIKQRLQALFKAHRLQWDDTAESILQQLLAGFNVYCGYSFLSVFWGLCLQAGADPEVQTHDEYIMTQAVTGTGFTTFERTHTSAPERISLDLAGGKDR